VFPLIQGWNTRKQTRNFPRNRLSFKLRKYTDVWAVVTGWRYNLACRSLNLKKVEKCCFQCMKWIIWTNVFFLIFLKKKERKKKEKNYKVKSLAKELGDMILSTGTEKEVHPRSHQYWCHIWNKRKEGEY